MIAGLGHLRLAPRDFWSMTPRELNAALTALYGDVAHAIAPSRPALDALVTAFPDTRQPTPNSRPHDPSQTLAVRIHDTI